MKPRSNRWHVSEKWKAHELVMEHVACVERNQADTYDRFVKLAAMYDPAGPDGYAIPGNRTMGVNGSTISQNLIAKNVDTAVASIAKPVRSRFQTEGAEWSVQREAKDRERYVEGVYKKLNGDYYMERMAHDAAKKGSGFIMVYADHHKGDVCYERIVPDDLIVDDGECRSEPKPRQYHRRVIADKDELIARFPKFEIDIERSVGSANEQRYWADYRPLERDDVVAVESWYMASGEYGEENYRAGRHTICIDGKTLMDEEYMYETPPFVRMVFQERDNSYYGISVSERIAGHQRRLNKMNWQTDKQRDRLAVPTMFVRLADANLAVKSTNRAGAVVPYKADLPQTIIPPAVGAEVYNRMDAIEASAQREVGQSEMSVNATKPAGLDSGRALREYKDQTSGRHRVPEEHFIAAALEMRVLTLRACKELGEDAPIVYKRSRWKTRRIEVGDIDECEVRLQIAAASDLANQPAGRQQFVLELAQGGIVSQDEARRLIGHPDIEKALSMYTAALEDLEACLEEIYDGAMLIPEPTQNLQMGVWRFQQAYLKVKWDGAPETVLENIRSWMDTAAYMVALAEQPPPMPAQLPGGAPGQLPPEILPGEASPPGANYTDQPLGPAPASALAPESIGVATA